MLQRSHKKFPDSEHLPKQLEFIGLHFDREGLRVRVSDFFSETQVEFEINFSPAPLAHRCMDEGNFLTSAWEAEEGVGPIVLVEGSDFLDWFQKESCGIHDPEELHHVAILTQNEWVEVICDNLPLITKLGV